MRRSALSGTFPPLFYVAVFCPFCVQKCSDRRQFNFFKLFYLWACDYLPNIARYFGTYHAEMSLRTCKDNFIIL